MSKYILSLFHVQYHSKIHYFGGQFGQFVFMGSSPAIELQQSEIPGSARMVLTTGTHLRNLIAMGKKPPKRATNPYISMIIPKIGQPRRRTSMPPKKAAVPLILSLSIKNREVLFKPITQAKPRHCDCCYFHWLMFSASELPERQNRFPIARRPRIIFNDKYVL